MDTRRILRGALGGLAGGMVFGMMMAMMGVLPMIGEMIGHPNAVTGFLLHMVNSAAIGAGFAVVVGRPGRERSRAETTVQGLTYGVTWWVLGPLTLMPLFLGMGLGANWNPGAVAAALPSLMGHMIYGAILGFTYGVLQGRAVRAARPATSHGLSAVRSG